MANTITIPVSMQFKVIDGKPVKQSAEYAAIDPDIIARMLLDAFRVHVEESK